MPPDGPLDAPVLWVGEAPGKEEELAGKPFVGPSGHEVRKNLRLAGINPDTQVRYANTVPFNPGQFPNGRAGAKLLFDHASQLDQCISEMPQLRVIVACGGPALTRLTGKHAVSRKYEAEDERARGWGITDWRGSVLRNADLPGEIALHPKFKLPTQYPPDIAIIPVLHPAGILRDPGRNEMFLFRRDVRKVKRYLDGTIAKHKYDLFVEPTHAEIYAAWEGKQWLYFDTEYDATGVYWIGLSFDAHTIFGCPWTPYYADIVAELMADEKLLKCAHNIHADVRVLERCGMHVRGDWWDTMVGFHALHPALDVGLDDAARYYIEDIANWKEMSTRDPQYNAMDVAYGACVMLGEWDEAAQRPVSPLPEIHARMKLLKVTQRMEERGMRIDMLKRTELLTDVQARIVKLRAQVVDDVKPIWDTRVRAELIKQQELEHRRDVYLTQYGGKCVKHITYNGVQRKPARCDTCEATHAAATAYRDDYARVRRELAAAEANAERWGAGFDAANNEHLRWLLYDPDGLRLPVQKDMRTKRPTANRTAIDKLLQHRITQGNPFAVSLIGRIKEVQHLEKAASTFLFADKKGKNQAKIIDSVAHPTYKVHGTTTGRLAGGDDDDEKSDNTYAFNPLNIPREWRVMYVPPPGHCFVEADWRNVEGRLVAYFSKDPYYNKVLHEEMNGGPKVHSVNAGIIYNIPPEYAQTHKIMLSGQEREAYDGGKRLSHGWGYGMGPAKMASTYNMSLAEAVRIDNNLRKAYSVLVSWREALVDRILGVWERVPGEKRRACTREGQRLLANPFGWQLHFLGLEGRQANEVIAFLPQSSGAGMWTRVAPQLEARYPIYTGTYDSFVLIVPDTAADIRQAAEFLRVTMEQTWPQLSDRSFPCEVSYGWNWGKYDAERNPRGLRAYEWE